MDPSAVAPLPATPATPGTARHCHSARCQPRRIARCHRRPRRQNGAGRADAAGRCAAAGRPGRTGRRALCGLDRAPEDAAAPCALLQLGRGAGRPALPGRLARCRKPPTARRCHCSPASGGPAEPGPSAATPWRWRKCAGRDQQRHARRSRHRLHALNNRARLLEQLRRNPEAEALMRRSVELKAAQPDVIQHDVHIRQKQCACSMGISHPLRDLASR